MKKIMILSISTLLIACNKEKPKPYSYWNINGTAYSSNNVEKAIGKGIALLGGRDNDRFDISFGFGSLPRSGTWPIIKTETHDPSFVGLFIYRGTTIYAMSRNENGVLLAADNEGKAQYTLNTTWFVNYNDPTDSVLISGTFNEP